MPHPFFLVYMPVMPLYSIVLCVHLCSCCGLRRSMLNVFLQGEIVNTPTCELYLLDLLVAVHWSYSCTLQLRLSLKYHRCKHVPMGVLKPVRGMIRSKKLAALILLCLLLIVIITNIYFISLIVEDKTKKPLPDVTTKVIQWTLSFSSRLILSFRVIVPYSRAATSCPAPPKTVAGRWLTRENTTPIKMRPPWQLRRFSCMPGNCPDTTWSSTTSTEKFYIEYSMISRHRMNWKPTTYGT